MWSRRSPFAQTHFGASPSPAMAAVAAGAALALLFAAGCENFPCTNDDDSACKSEVTGLVCNMSMTLLLPSIGTCQYPGEVDDPCADTRDCATGYACEILDEDGLCKASLGNACARNEDCYGYYPKAGPNTCVGGTCSRIGRYGDPCDEDNDCWGGLECHPVAHICV